MYFFVCVCVWMFVCVFVFLYDSNNIHKAMKKNE